MELTQETLMGLIMMLVLGPAVGNYATSVVYRLPFNQTPFEKNPYCGDCSTMLQPKDLFPIISFLSTRGKCRYCGVKIRPSYTVIEVVCGVIFIVNFLLFGVSEDFILLTTLATFLVILGALDYHEKKLFTLIWTYCAALAALYRVLHDASIYPFFYSAFAMMFVAIIWWRGAVALKKMQGEVVPEFIWLAVLMGIIFPLNMLPIVLAFSVASYALFRALKINSQIMATCLGIYAGLVCQAMTQIV